MHCGLDVAPGDLVVGNADDVAVIPKGVVGEATAKARALRDEKEAMLPLIAHFKSYTKAVAEYRRRLPASKPER